MPTMNSSLRRVTRRVDRSGLALLASALGILTIAGCARSNAVSVQAAPVSSTSEDSQAQVVVTETYAEHGDRSEQPASQPLSHPFHGLTANTQSVRDEDRDESTEAADSADGDAVDAARPDRTPGLAQFGGGRGGGRGGGGGFGGGGGGRGGGGLGGGGLGGGGGGGLGGGLGGGGGGLGGGGVAIDPKIQLKADSSGKLEQRRKDATQKKPEKGGFSAD